MEINLIDALPRAERRAALPVTDAFRLDVAGPPADRRLGLVISAPARLIWSERLHPRARLRASFVLVPGAPPGSGVTLRIGVSDQRVYEMLFTRQLLASNKDDAAWIPLDLDLGAYGGWQWSLFYRPWNTTWRINVSVDAHPHGAVALERPRIEMER